MSSGKDAITTYLYACRIEHALWVAEQSLPFSVVASKRYQRLMKTGRTRQYVPSKKTVSRDVVSLFCQARKKLSAQLKVSI